MSGGGSFVVENSWTCRSCGQVNPGRELRCSQCGKLREGEAFDTTKATTSEAVTDERLLQLAAAGAHWTCAYCRFQNRGDATKCANCMAERAVAPAPAAGAAPQGPTVTPVGAPSGPTVTPLASIGAPQVTQIPVQKGKSLTSILALPALLIVCIATGVYFFRPKSGAAEVQSVAWTTVTKLEQRVPVRGQGWQEALPAGATVSACEPRVNGTMPCNPYPCVVAANGQCNPHECNCQNQCRDLGNGFSECQRVCGTCYDTCPVGQQSTCYQQCPRTGQWCTFSVDEWRPLQQATASGVADAPHSAQGLVAAGPDQRVRDETVFTVVFTGTNGARHEYHPTTLDAYRRFAVGQRWTTRETNAGGFEPVALK